LAPSSKGWFVFVMPTLEQPPLLISGVYTFLQVQVPFLGSPPGPAPPALNKKSRKILGASGTTCRQHHCDQNIRSLATTIRNDSCSWHGQISIRSNNLSTLLNRYAIAPVIYDVIKLLGLISGHYIYAYK
jgi:hypothetical protein